MDHPTSFEALRARLFEVARASVRLVSAEALFASADRYVLLDVRETDELVEGTISGAKHIPRGLLEMQVRTLVAADQAICVFCASGQRSLLAAQTLGMLGYRSVASLEGGLQAWKAAGLALEVVPRLSSEERARYARHLSLPELGEAGQLALRKARVLLVGAGGLGSPAALYLAAAGVGTLGIADHDKVELSNLQRQILHQEAELGQPKVNSAQRALHRLNPSVQVQPIEARLRGEVARSVLEQGWDVVVDGTDHIPSRYELNTLCLEFGIPWVYAALHKFDGQLAVIDPSTGPCYQCIYPSPPSPEATPSCAEAGVVGAMVGVLGSMQALQAVLLITGAGEPLRGKLLRFDGLTGECDTFQVPVDPNCRCQSLSKPCERPRACRTETEEGTA